MKSNISIFLLFWSLALHAFSQPKTIEQFLKNQSTITYKTLESPKGKHKTFELSIRQPIDHADTTKGYFYQKAFLSHQGFDRPTVIETEGYSLRSNTLSEVTELLQANQLGVEHRYFGRSFPDSIAYEYLNLTQASADLHHIHELFKPVYAGNWISTGVSKGGVSTLYYNYFYPDDVVASVAYVAPIANATEDTRIYTFLDTVGTDECREKINNFQLQLLKHRDQIMPMLKSYYSKKGHEFTYLSFEEAYEYAALEFSFGFWQWGNSCKSIPKKEATATELALYFLSTNPMSLFSDAGMNYYGPHYYQAATEMGYYGYDITSFKDYLIALPTDSNPSAIFTPNKMVVPFSDSLNQAFTTWLATEGNHIIYLYGALDTWSACAVTPSEQVDAKVFMLPNKHHGNANISGMTGAQKKILKASLENWLSMKIK